MTPYLSSQVSGSGADGYDNADVIMAMSVEGILYWIMDLGGSYRITYMIDYFVDFEEYDGGKILLGDGKECRIRGTVTRRANCAYTLDGHAVTRKTLKGIQQQNGLVEETNVTLLAKVRCFLIQSGLSKVFWAGDTTMSTYLVNGLPSSVIGSKTPIDMLRFFGWLASIKQGMLELVKVNCIFLGNMGFNESGEYKKTFIGSSDTGSVQVLQGVEFEVELQEDHAFEVEPQGDVSHIASSQEVQTHDLLDYHSALKKIYAHESLTFNDTIACEVISKRKTRLKVEMDARSDVYVLNNGCKKCSDDNDGYYWEYTLGNVLGIKIVKDQSGNTLRVSQSRFYNKKLVQTLLEEHSILSLEGSLLGDCDVEKNDKWLCIYAVGSQEYQMVCTRLDIASTDVGMLDKFDRGLQTNVQVFVDFDYTMGRSITVIAEYITLTNAAKEAIWLKGLAIESGFELKIVAGIATGTLSKAIPSPRFQQRLNLLSIGIG
ncbi:zinc finger, CCHC-type containing protein [Tanacetum coccineum]